MSTTATLLRRWVPAAGCALALVLVGCGGPAQPAAPPAPPTASNHGTAGHAAAGHNSSGGLELWAVQSSPLGVVVADGGGRVVYRSDRDSNQPPTSTCLDACAATWEPLLTGDGPPVLLGVEESKIGLLARPDGTQQVTLAGWPLYRRAGEPAGLQSAGANGADGVWFAVAPDGEKATTG